MPDDGAPAQKRYFNAAIVAPLEEEFEILLDHFVIGDNLTDDNNIRFAATVQVVTRLSCLSSKPKWVEQRTAAPLPDVSPNLMWDYLFALGSERVFPPM